MFVLTYIPALRTLLQALGLTLALSTLVPIFVPAAASWPLSAPRARHVHGIRWHRWTPDGFAQREESLGDLALQGRLPGDPLPPRDRIVAMENVSTHEKATFFVGPDGHVRSDQTATLEYFFRCRRTERHGPIDPRLMAVVADIAEHWPGRVIEFLSGFRTPPYGAPKSRHFIGHALDMRVRGVPSTAVRDYVWREHRGVGVGHYPEEDFVHVDARTDQQEIAWSGRDESTTLFYNPRWASLARPHTSH
jgi:uncharacterized protein YcbK (DUF882 family)